MKIAELFELAESPGVVLTPAARKAKHDAEKRFKDNVKHVKTSGFNLSYSKKHNLDEGLLNEAIASNLSKVLKGLGYKLVSQEKTRGEAKSWWQYKDATQPLTMKELIVKLKDVDPSVQATPNWQKSDKTEQMSMAYEFSGNLIRGEFQEDRSLFTAIFQATKGGKQAKQDHDNGFDPSARFESMKIDEGMFVVKSADGVEKRFKDADSTEAKAWKQRTAKNIKLADYSDAYWKEKEDDSNDRDFITPWKKIGDADSDQIERIVKDQLSGAGTADWTLGKADETLIDGTTRATRMIRVMFEYGPDDDMGVDEPTSDTQSILIARNPKKPKQLDFIKYIS